jgi:predicted nucleotidyltransferase component of viral defense system
MPAPLRDRLRREAQRLRVPEDVVERDYALGHVLAALYGQAELADCLVFKGGTALKKAYFGDYRFSVDLDFSAVGGPRRAALEAYVRQAGVSAVEALNDFGRFDLEVSRRRNTGPHPGGQEAFTALVQFPWRGRAPCSIKLEITVDEPVLLPVAPRPLIHGYDESLAVTLRCYALEEIVAEKLRTLLQARKRLEARRWMRNCARDYYDLWRLGSARDLAIDWQVVQGVLGEKCAVRGVEFVSVDDFFAEAIVDAARRQWESSLTNLVRDLPLFDSAIEDVRRVVSTIV